MREFSASNLEDDLSKIKNKKDAKKPLYLAEAILRYRYAHKLTIDKFVDHVKAKGLHTTSSAIKSYATRGSYPSDDDLKKFADILDVSFETLKYGVTRDLIQVQSLTGLSPTSLANLVELNKATLEEFKKEAENAYAQGDMRPSRLDSVPRGNETKIINWILEDKSFLILLARKVSAIEYWSSQKQQHGEYFTGQGDDMLDGAKARIQRELLSLIEKRVEEESNYGRKKENKER